MTATGAGSSVAWSRLISVLVGLALMLVAAVGYRLSQPQTDFQIVRAAVGELTAYDKGRAGVRNVQVATELTKGEARLKTTGLFVLVRMTVQAPNRDEVHIQNTELVAADARYTAVGLGSTVFAEPGFETSRDVAFEVNPERMADLTVEAWDSDLVMGYHQRLRVHLGITADNAAQWTAAAQGQRLALDVDETLKGLP